MCAVERGGPELETATFAAYTSLESARVGDALAASPKFPVLLQIITEGLAGRGGGREGGLAEGSDEAAGALKALLSSRDATIRLEKGERRYMHNFHSSLRIPFSCEPPRHERGAVRRDTRGLLMCPLTAAEGLASILAGKLVAMVASAEESRMAASTLNQVDDHDQSALEQDMSHSTTCIRYIVDCKSVTFLTADMQRLQSCNCRAS